LGIRPGGKRKPAVNRALREVAENGEDSDEDAGSQSIEVPMDYSI